MPKCCSSSDSSSLTLKMVFQFEFLSISLHYVNDMQPGFSTLRMQMHSVDDNVFHRHSVTLTYFKKKKRGASYLKQCFEFCSHIENDCTVRPVLHTLGSFLLSPFSLFSSSCRTTWHINSQSTIYPMKHFFTLMTIR